MGAWGVKDYDYGTTHVNSMILYYGLNAKDSSLL